MTSDKRYNFAISTIRLISMLMIITCHFMQYLNVELAWWFNVGVQIFFVISGFLYGAKTIKDPLTFYKKSFVKILIPYWTFLFVAVIVQRVLVPETFSWGKVFLAFLCVGRLDGIEHLWFVQTILICYLLLPLFLLIKENIIRKPSGKAIIWMLFCILMLQFVGFSFNGYAMIPNRITCFAMGIVLSVIYQRKGSLTKPCIIFGAAALIMNAVRIYFHYVRDLTGNQLFVLFERYSHGVLGIAIVLLLYQAFRNVKSNIILRLSDKYSYHIYLVHQIFILGPLTLMNLTAYTALNIVIILLCIIVSGFLLQFICSYLEKPVKRFLKIDY